MGAILGLLAGSGLLLIVLGVSGPSGAKRARESRLQRLIDRAGMERVRPGTFLAASVGAGLLAALVTFAISGVLVVGLLAAVAVGLIPYVVLRRRSTARVKALRGSWPDAVDVLASAVRAGLSLPEAVADLGTRGPEPLRPAFMRFATEYRATGSFALALDVLADTMRDPVADRVVIALGIAREVGGSDLGRVLTTLSEFLREDARTRGEIEARQSWTVNGARIAVAAPWITLALLCTRPEAMAAYSTAMGAVILIGAAVLSVVAYRVMIALGRLPSEPRVMA